MGALIDIIIFTPFWYYPVYYIVQDMYCGPKGVQSFNPRRIWQTYTRNWVSDMKACGSFYFPVLVINQWIVPRHWRQMFVLCVGTIWSIILSKMRGNYEEVEEEPSSQKSDL